MFLMIIYGVQEGIDSMRRFLLIALLFITTSGMVFAAEVSEEQDIAIFGLTTYDYNVPEEVIGYVHSSINHEFVSLKRFNVIGYGDYRLESKDIDDFIERIKELQVEKAKEAGTYDEKFGTIVIKGEDFDRIVSSFLIVQPSLSNYREEAKRTVVVTEDSMYWVTKYEVDVVVDLFFINVREGTQEESLRITGSATGQSPDGAKRKAIDEAMSMLAFNIKKIDMFKIRSGVIQVSSDRVFFELGSDIGVRLGDEYAVMTKSEVGNTGRIVQIPTGLVRVRKVYPDVTEAQIVIQKERITEGDQLVEVAKRGIQLSFNTGVMMLDVPDMDYDLVLVDDTEVGLISPATFYSFDLEQPEKGFAPIAGLSVAKSLGYRLKGVLDLTAILNFPLFGGLGEIGVGTSLYKRRMGLDLSVFGGVLYMTIFSKDLDPIPSDPLILTIEGTKVESEKDPVMNIYGLAFGAKGGAAFTFRLNPNNSIRAGLNYRLYTPIENWTIHIEETSGSSKESFEIDSDSPNILEDANTEGLKRVSISGFEATLSYTLRF